MKTISDEMLSAFLDNALSTDDMNLVRDAIAKHETIADRLAQLALVDEYVKQHAQQIDTVAPPEAVMQELARPKTTPLRFIQRASAFHLAAAASLAMVAFVLAFTWQPQPNQWAQVQQHLSATPSGATHPLDDGGTFIAQFSFISDSNDLCRVYRVAGEQVAEAIACYRPSSGWQEVVRVAVPNTIEGDYMLSSGSTAIQAAMRDLGAGPALKLADEARHLEQQR